MAWHAIDAIQPGIDKTRAFFTGPNLFWKWVKIGLLLFVFSILSGGGVPSSNFSLPADSGGGEAIEQALSDLSFWFASLPLQTVNLFIILAMAGIVVLFVIGIILTLLKNMCFFAVLESASTNRVKIIPYLKKFYRKALSLTVLEIVLDLIGLPFALVLLLASLSFLLFILGIDPGVLGPLAGLASNFLLMVVLVMISVIALIVLTVVRYILGQFAAYWMYLSRMKAWEAFKKSVSLVRRNLAQIAVLIVMQIILGIAAAIISMVALILVAIPFAIVGILLGIALIPLIAQSPAVLIPAILLLIVGIFILILVASIILAPVPLFFFNYNLLFLKKLLPKRKH